VQPSSARYLRWTSDTSLGLSVSSGVGRSSSFRVTAASQTGSILHAFSYETPFVSSVSVTNLPLTSCAIVTISGSNFGPFATSTKARISFTAFQAVGWISDSSVICKSPRGYMQVSFLAVTTAILSSTTSAAFSFESPSISMSVRTNVPASGSSSVTLIGNAYSLFDASASSQVGGTSVHASTWFSVSSIRLKVGSGAFSSLSSVISLKLRSSLTQLFSYDVSVVSSINVPFLPSSGSVSMTVFGRNYGVSSYSAAKRFEAWHNGSNA